jgi:hypothetical protein
MYLRRIGQTAAVRISPVTGDIDAEQGGRAGTQIRERLASTVPVAMYTGPHLRARLLCRFFDLPWHRRAGDPRSARFPSRTC